MKNGSSPLSSAPLILFPKTKHCKNYLYFFQNFFYFSSYIYEYVSPYRFSFCSHKSLYSPHCSAPCVSLLRVIVGDLCVRFFKVVQPLFYKCACNSRSVSQSCLTYHRFCCWVLRYEINRYVTHMSIGLTSPHFFSS